MIKSKIRLLIYNKKISIALATFIFALIAGLFFLQRSGMMDVGKNDKTLPTADINGHRLKLEIADTDALRYQGLSDRDSICAECGMLFNFESYGELIFVMRNMRFPLDIIFIKDDTIVKIHKNLPPEGPEPKEFYQSYGPANHVLEVNGGWCDKHGIKEGDRLKY
jgi:uncharacterized protein